MSEARVVIGQVYRGIGYEVMALDEDGQPVGEEYRANNHKLSGGSGLSKQDAKDKWYGMDDDDLFEACKEVAEEMAEEHGVEADVRFEEDW
jgi:hypothetical protein